MNSGIGNFEHGFIPHEQQLKISQEAVEALLKNKDSLEQRLSHLMDVAGKMAGSLVMFAGLVDDADTDFIDAHGDTVIRPRVKVKEIELANAIVAEWDGIKEEKP